LLGGKVRMRTDGLAREVATHIAWSGDGQSLLWTAQRSGPIPQPHPPVQRSFDLTRLALGSPPADAERHTAQLKDADREITGDKAYYFTLSRRKDRKEVRIEPRVTYDDFYVHSITLLAGERAALASDHGLALHDTVTGVELFSWTPAQDSNDLAAAPDGRTLATGGTTMNVYKLDRPDRLLALHVVGEKWVAWSGDGYFAANWNGDLPVGRFIDHGSDKLAEFVPLNRLKDRYRPDVIGRLLTAGSLETALRESPRAGKPMQ
jgi:hypothetical protein